MNINFDKWCEKLLDTGKNNKLINYKDSKLRTLEIFAPSINTIFNKLKGGTKLSFYDVDAYVRKCIEEQKLKVVVNEEEIENDDFAKVSFTKTQIIDVLGPNLSVNDLLAHKNYLTLKKVLKTISKAAKDSLTEKGLNILYMAFGFLKWSDPSEPNVWYKSPLNLIPISLKNNPTGETYYVTQYEDEISTNPTLLYKLKADFGITIPDFDEETCNDLDQHFAKITTLVEKLGWSVINEVAIGTFSFYKMNMYNDLKTNEVKILENNNVVRLMNKEVFTFSDEPNNETTSEIAGETNEIALHNVVDADSSQVEAIIYAKSGKNFVLQGPPGTGKSQTITNLIAEFLYDGKKILFVSEKLAALSVVQNNLSKVGLADFCLALHSNKTNKKEVIAELFRTIKLSETLLTARVDEEIADFLRNKKQLDTYVNELHTKVAVIERTPFEILGVVAKLHSIKEFDYVITDIEQKDQKFLSDVLYAISDYQQSIHVIGLDFRQNCWYGFNTKETSYQFKHDLKKLLEGVISYLEPLSDLIKQLNDKYQINLNCLTDLNQMMAFFETLVKMNFFDNVMFEKNKLSTLIEFAHYLNDTEKKIKTKQNEVANVFNDDFYSTDFDMMIEKFTNEYKSSFRFLKANYRKDMLYFKGMLTCKKTNYKTVCSMLTCGKEYKLLVNELKCLKTEFLELLHQKKTNCQWQTIISDLTNLDSVMPQSMLMFKDVDIDDLKSYVSIFNKFTINNQIVDQLQTFFALNTVDFVETDIDEVLFKISNCFEKFEQIDFWSKFLRTIETFEKLGSYDFLTKSIDEKIPPTELDKTFKKMFYKQWFFYEASHNETLNNFSRVSHDSAVMMFKEKDRLKFSIAQAKIAAKLSTLRPNLALSSSGGQVRILQREALKSRKQMPVRLLLKTIPALVQTLKPCFLMSPLSVSTYLDDDAIKFDVVIFDEASQIFPWDAVGAIYRAKQVIVVGDSKQMPPSNFFVSGVVEDENDEDYDNDSLDFESILDLCATSFEQKTLKWHYRSKVEELIAFSNKNFYQNSLVTFPSNHHGINDGVQFYPVIDGIFDRKARNNINEAKKIVDLIYQHFEETPNRSLGVVAFSVSQQETIEELLQKRRSLNDKHSSYFDETIAEPFFVKNLETIQGDERDTIIFSVGYAKDETGKFIHNFGPLNKKGGERRLNVAVTRAKYNVKLVSSINTYDIDLKKSQAEGTKLLKEYLDYAENGYVENSQTKANSESDIDFEIEVYDFLKEAGFTVDLQVGCSGHKVDLAVKHPTKDIYVLAIECDGFTYHSRKSTRDRDRLRQEILEKLGWQFYRIWSTDWFRNNQAEKKLLLEQIKNAIMQFDQGHMGDQSSLVNQTVKESETIVLLVDKQVQEISLVDSFPKYEEANIDELIIKNQKIGQYGKNLDYTSFINDVVRIEQPITEELLLKKICRIFGREKVTSVVKEQFYLKMKRNFACKKIDNYYTMDPFMPINLRLPKDGMISRDVSLICKEEIAAGFIQIVKNNVGITKEGIFRTINNLLGFTRLGDNITKSFDEALDYLIKKRLIKQENELYFINE